MSLRWRKIADGEYIAYDRDGNLHFRQAPSRADLEETYRLQAERRKTKEREGPAGLRPLASLPHGAMREMERQCGDDPEKRQAFLRDHPRFLSQPARRLGLPGKKAYFYFGKRRGK